MTAYKDEKRGTWFVNFRYKDWRGESKQKSKRGFRTKRETQACEHGLKTEMSRAKSMGFSFTRNPYPFESESHMRKP